METNNVDITVVYNQKTRSGDVGGSAAVLARVFGPGLLCGNACPVGNGGGF
jgi:hypothetical protein